MIDHRSYIHNIFAVSRMSVNGKCLKRRVSNKADEDTKRRRVVAKNCQSNEKEKTDNTAVCVAICSG